MAPLHVGKLLDGCNFNLKCLACSLYKATNSAILTYIVLLYKVNFMQMLTWVSSTNKESTIKCVNTAQ